MSMLKPNVRSGCVENNIFKNALKLFCHFPSLAKKEGMLVKKKKKGGEEKEEGEEEANLQVSV